MAVPTSVRLYFQPTHLKWVYSLKLRETQKHLVKSNGPQSWIFLRAPKVSFSIMVVCENHIWMCAQKQWCIILMMKICIETRCIYLHKIGSYQFIWCRQKMFFLFWCKWPNLSYIVQFNSYLVIQHLLLGTLQISNKQQWHTIGHYYAFIDTLMTFFRQTWCRVFNHEQFIANVERKRNFT